MAPAKTPAPLAKADAAGALVHEDERRPPTAVAAPLGRLAGNRAVAGLLAEGGPALQVLRSRAGEDAADTAARQVAAGAKVSAALAPVPAGVVQLSPMSRALEDDIKHAKGDAALRQAVLYRLRRFGPAANDIHTSAVINRVFKDKPDDLWLAKTLQKYGAEPNWPAEELAKRRGKAAGQPRHFGTELAYVEGTVPGKQGLQRLPIEAFWFEGQTDERALVIGGVHGTERSGIEVAKRLVNRLLQSTTKPYYTTIVVPELFPLNAARGRAVRNDSSNEARWVRTPTGDVRTSKKGSSATDVADPKAGEKGKLDPNRTLPAAGASLATARKTGVALDAEGRPIPPETVVMLELITRFKPSRIASVHAIHGRAGGGFFADPETTRKDASQADKEAGRRLALAMALRAAGVGAADARTLAADPKQIAKAKVLDPNLAKERVPGNRLTTGAPRSDYGVPGGVGTSLGGWGSTPIKEGGKDDRPAMTIITVEVPETYPAEEMPDTTAKEQAAKKKRQDELEAGATSLQDVFLGGP